MSAQTNIIAFDGAASPVSHTFTAAGVDNDPALGLVAEYREILASVPEAAQCRLQATKRKLKSGIWRIQISLAIPTMETISGQNAAGYTAAPKIAYETTHAYVVYVSPRATPAERKLGRQLLINIINGIATSVTPVITGNAAELVDSGIFPS